MKLRPYQLEALETSKRKFLEGVTRQLIALPTGTGKTPLFASVRNHFGFNNKVMFLVHREELAQQAADKLRTWNPNVSVGIEMADQTSGPRDELIVASVPTIGRAGNTRILKFRPEEFDAIIVDECHHSTARSYLNIFKHFGLHAEGNKKLLLGVTATPTRGDGAALGKVYDEIIYQMPIIEAIKAGWLVDLRGYKIKTTTSLDGVHTIGGDFAQNELADEVNTPQRNDLIVRKWLENGQDRQTVAFTVDIQHAKDLAEVFRRYGVAAEAVWGDDPYRQDKLREHRRGSLRVLCNCGVLTEGYDDPGIGCIVLARPTKSGLLFVQMSGRGTRLPEGVNNLLEAKASGQSLSKTDCILMDVVDNTDRHSLVTLSSLFGLGNKMDMKGQSVVKTVDKIEELSKKHPTLDVSKIEDATKIDAYVQSVDLFTVKYPDVVIGNSKLQWYQNTAKDSYVLLLPNNEEVVISKDLLGHHRVSGVVKGNRFSELCGDLPEAFRMADQMVSTFGRDLLHLLRREAKWHDGPATPRQLGLLNRLRIAAPAGLTKGEAAKKISQFFATGRKVA